MGRLWVKEIDSVGLVDEGDNPEAKVSFWKRKPKTITTDGSPSSISTPGADSAPQPVEISMPEIDLSALDDDTRDSVEKALEAASKLESVVTELEAKVTELTPEPDPVDSADPELQAEFAKRDDEITKLRAQVDAADDKAATAEYAEMVKARPASFKDSEDEATKVLKTLGAVDRDALDWLLGKLDAVEKIVAESDLFKEFGSGDAGSATASIEALAKERQAENPDLSPAAARELARRLRPDLKDAEFEETH